MEYSLYIYFDCLYAPKEEGRTDKIKKKRYYSKNIDCTPGNGTAEDRSQVPSW
jgi:hypothetical protein